MSTNSLCQTKLHILDFVYEISVAGKLEVAVSQNMFCNICER